MIGLEAHSYAKRCEALRNLPVAPASNHLLPILPLGDATGKHCNFAEESHLPRVWRVSQRNEVLVLICLSSYVGVFFLTIHQYLVGNTEQVATFRLSLVP